MPSFFDLIPIVEKTSMDANMRNAPHPSIRTLAD